MHHILFLIINLFILKCTNTLIYQDLGGKWFVENFQKGYHLPAQVPGGIYTDLMNNKIIEDVFYGSNDINTRWVSKLNWNYSRRFVVNETLVNHDVINLVLDGIDTFSKILINNVEVGETENMFVQYIINVKPYLVVGYNDIQVQFKSPIEVALNEYEEQSKEYVVFPKCVPVEYNGECHVNHIRKMQASFSWDWGPALPSMGIWKQLYLEAYNSTIIRYVTVDIISNNDQNRWDLRVYAYLSKNNKNSTIYGKLNTKLYTDTAVIININKVVVTENKNGDIVAVVNITVAKTYVREWWPNGYGAANLYNLDVVYINPQESEESKKTLKIGFRTIELVQNVIESGREFYFRVNGFPIFAKGSNIIPINILPELGQTEETIRYLLKSAKSVHMNMLRVWGGSVYESEMFYQLADEMGILIWQDFMFACSMYPTKENFLRNVKDEVRHQVRRLQHHPSIALWAGNNENEAALRQNWYNTSSNFSLYKKDYIDLYVNTVKPELFKYDYTRTYLISSPTNGLQSEKEGYIAENPQSHFYGDVHFYNYLVDSWQTSIYPITRFASEYGYQSLPSISTLLTATNNTDDLTINSEFLRNRQHKPLGYDVIKLLIQYQLNLPQENSPNFFKAFVYYSQIIQAMAVKIQTEYYRQWRTTLNSIGEGFTMGALYWQLNDVWVAPTWSSIDYKNNWKMLHYFAKKFFASVIITGNITIDHKLNVYVISDLIQVIRNVTVTVSIFKWNSFIPLKKESLLLDILPGMSQKINMHILDTFLTNDIAKACGKGITQCFIHLALKSNNSLAVHDNHIFPAPLKTANLQTPKMQVIQIQQIDKTNTLFKVTVATNSIALFVWMETGNIRGHFSDNGFLQLTENRTVYFFAEKPTTVVELTKSLTITNLLDNNYQ